MCPGHGVTSCLCRVVGGEYADDSVRDGMLVPGGSISNVYALHLARIRADPDYKRRGAAGGPVLVAFCSKHAHYSYRKAAQLVGLGLDNMVGVECGEDGAMDPAALDAAVARAVAEGRHPFFVGATAGTTVFSAYDPLGPLAKACERHGMWLHVDGCWGAAALLSRRHRGILAGECAGYFQLWAPGHRPIRFLLPLL